MGIRRINFGNIFNVFSRRPSNKESSVKRLTDSFRNRIIMLCSDSFDNRTLLGQEAFWEETHKRLQYLHGKPKLSDDMSAETPFADVLSFLLTCSDNHFLDFVEYIFQSERYSEAFPDEDELVIQINQLFQVDDLPYAVTKFVREKQMRPFAGQPRETLVLISYPKVIRRDNQVIYKSTIEPTLSLLTEKAFSSANIEFLEALEDFRKGDYGDCLSKCSSSLESVMKIICSQKSLPYKQTDTAAPLLRTILDKSNLDPFFEQPLMIVATLRNRLSKSHGSGTSVRSVPAHIANYAINATASMILLLVEETS